MQHAATDAHVVKENRCIIELVLLVVAAASSSAVLDTVFRMQAKKL